MSGMEAYRRHARGLCMTCKRPSETNKRRGLPYWKCRPCRQQAADRYAEKKRQVAA